MRTVEMTIYKVNELSEGAKERAFHDWLGNSDYGWNEDNHKSLEAFAKVFPISINSWEYDQWRGHVSFDFEEEPEIEEMSGIRLMKYIYNNYWNQITKGKYYSLWSKTEKSEYNPNMGKLKHRYSKVMIVEPSSGACPFTGYYMDEEILDPIFDFLKKPSEGVTFYDLMEECLQSWVDACVKDYRYCSSMEYFEEEAEANDYEFYEDGSRF